MVRILSSEFFYEYMVFGIFDASAACEEYQNKMIHINYMWIR